MESLATILSPEEKACRKNLKSTESDLRAEYNRLQAIAYDFWARAQAVKAEADLLEAERLDREKAEAKVKRIPARRRGQARTSETAEIFAKAMRMAEEIAKQKKEGKNV